MLNNNTKMQNFALNSVYLNSTCEIKLTCSIQFQWEYAAEHTKWPDSLHFEVNPNNVSVTI